MSDFDDAAKSFFSDLRGDVVAEVDSVEDAPEWSGAWADAVDNVVRWLGMGLYKTATKDRGWGQMNLWPEQEHLLYLIHTQICKLRRPMELLLGKPRQMGASNVFAPVCVEILRQVSGVNGVLAANETPNYTKLFRMYKNYMRQYPGRNEEDVAQPETNNARELVWPTMKSGLSTGVANENLGVSGTVQLAHLSEVCLFRDYAAVMTDAIGPAIPPHPCMKLIIKESTGKPNTPFEPEYIAALDAFAQCDFDLAKLDDDMPVAYFVPWFNVDEYRVKLTPALEKKVRDSLTPDERRLVRTHSVDMGQVEWMRRQLAKGKLAGNVAAVRRNYPASPDDMFSAGEGSYFDEDTLVSSIAAARVHKPSFVGEIGLTGSRLEGHALYPMKDGPFRVWQPPIHGHEYTIGVDPSGDSGAVGDRDSKHNRLVNKSESYAIVWNNFTGVAVASLRGIYDPFDFADMCVALQRYYNSAQAVIENQYVGTTVIKRMLQVGATNLYSEFTKRRASDFTRYGFYQTPEKRRGILARLKKLFDSGRVLIPDSTVLHQMARFSPQRVERSGSHRKRDLDDGVMAAAIGLEVASQDRSGRERTWAIKDPDTLEFIDSGESEAEQASVPARFTPGEVAVRRLADRWRQTNRML
jgi:hypothetical protein